MTYEQTIRAITARYPDLDVAGFERHTRDATRHDWSEYTDAFYASLDYLATLKQTATYSRHAPSSYGLKHDVERVTAACGRRIYTPNGVMIAALIHDGVPFKRDGINATVQVSPRSRTC